MNASALPKGSDDILRYDFVVLGGGSAGYAAARTDQNHQNFNQGKSPLL